MQLTVKIEKLQTNNKVLCLQCHLYTRIVSQFLSELID